MSFHLIDEKCQLNDGLSKYISQTSLNSCNKGYNIVSVIGSQNSGKSTLLNRVFGTTFEVLKGSNKVQTTKGVWASPDKDQNLIVLDVEGANSRQRGKNERGSEFYERSTALFALAFSQVLIINCNSLNLGHESEYNLIRTIMEMNVRLFKSDQVKHLLIVIRDFNDHSEDFGEVCTSIKKEIYGIWNEVIKPAELQNVPPENIFKIDFFKVAHFKFEKERFELDMQQLRERFANPSNKSYLFSNYNYNTNMPVDALEELAIALWSTIQNNQDLNLPSSKLQASQVRCMKIKDQSLELVSKPIEDIKKSCQDSLFKNFAASSRELTQNSLQFYDQESRYYVDSIKQQIRKTLQDEIKNQLFPLFSTQISYLKEQILSDLKNNLQDLNDTTRFLKDYIEGMDTIKFQLQKQISDGLTSLVPFQEYNIEWEVGNSTQEIQKRIKQVLDNALELKFIQFQITLEKQIKRQIDSFVSNEFDSLGNDFWSHIRNQFNDVLKQSQKTLQQQTALFFDKNRIEREVNKIIAMAYSILQQEISKKSKELPYYLLKKYDLSNWFKTEFQKDQNMMTWKWKQLQEEQIQKLFENAKSASESILSLFLSYQFFDKSQIGTQDYDRSIQLSGGVTDIQLLSQEQVNKMKAQFNEETKEEFNSVMRQRNVSMSGSVPKWMWGILIFFMYDDVLRWMGNPLLLYPLLLLISFIGVTVVTGYSEIPKKLLSDVLGYLTQMVGSAVIKAR